jgi:hypothetical protein
MHASLRRYAYLNKLPAGAWATVAELIDETAVSSPRQSTFSVRLRGS